MNEMKWYARKPRRLLDTLWVRQLVGEPPRLWMVVEATSKRVVLEQLLVNGVIPARLTERHDVLFRFFTLVGEASDFQKLCVGAWLCGSVDADDDRAYILVSKLDPLGVQGRYVLPMGVFDPVPRTYDDQEQNKMKGRIEPFLPWKALSDYRVVPMAERVHISTLASSCVRWKNEAEAMGSSVTGLNATLRQIREQMAAKAEAEKEPSSAVGVPALERLEEDAD